MNLRRCSTFNWVVWLCSDTLAQVIEYFFNPPSAPRHSPSGNTDEEILAIFRHTKYKDFSSPNRPRYITVRITKDTVLKPFQDVPVEEEPECPSEVLAQRLVSEQTTIPVPQVRRVIKSIYTTYIAVEYIPGRRLSVVWPTLSWLGRIRVAFTIRPYVQQLRRIKHPRSSVPGPLAGPSEGGMMCQSPLFGPVVDSRGPFDTYADLAKFFNDRQALTLPRSKVKRSISLEDLTTFDDSQALVFCIQNLNPDSFIVGEHGRLWLVDWVYAGFYPP